MSMASSSGLFERATRRMAGELLDQHRTRRVFYPVFRLGYALGWHPPLMFAAQLPSGRKILQEERTGFRGKSSFLEAVGDDLLDVFVFKETEPRTVLDEYAESLRNDPEVLNRTSRLQQQTCFGLKSMQRPEEGWLRAACLNDSIKRENEAQRVEKLRNVELKVASEVVARNRILDELNRRGLIGKTETHRAVITANHARRLADFCGVPRGSLIREVYDAIFDPTKVYSRDTSFENIDPVTGDKSFDQKRWKDYLKHRHDYKRNKGIRGAWNRIAKWFKRWKI